MRTAHRASRTVALGLGWLLSACAAGPAGSLVEGPWHAWLDSPGGELPFGLDLRQGPDGLQAFLVNGVERIEIDSVALSAGRLVLGIDHYDSRIDARWSRDGTRLDGEWSKTGLAGATSRLPFHATSGAAPRFPLRAPKPGAPGIGGRWAIDFSSDELPAVGLFDATAEGSVTGTILTATGDYRYLAGGFDGSRLLLSCFDGAHAFLFDARLRDDGTLAGDFWSRDSWHETWTARLDPTARPVDPFSQTRAVDGVDLAAMVYPDLDGQPRALDDAAFAGRARLLVVFGSWCPNCNDASAYLVELDRRFRERGLSILGLAFEMTGSFERDARQVRAYAAYHGIDYPLLVAGTADKDEASTAFPLIDRVRSYPTLIFMDADARVRAVYSGFAGPATGEAHRELRAGLESLIERLLVGADPVRAAPEWG